MFKLSNIIISTILLTAVFLLLFGWADKDLYEMESELCSISSLSQECIQVQAELNKSVYTNLGIMFLLIISAFLQYTFLAYRDAIEIRQMDEELPETHLTKTLTKVVDNSLYLLSTNKPFAPKELSTKQAKQMKLKLSSEVDGAFKHQYFYRPVQEENAVKYILVGSN